jgi:hypothetical protein
MEILTVVIEHGCSGMTQVASKCMIDALALADTITTRNYDMAKIQGGCLCGAIRYESSGEPSRMAASDCRHCQKQAGAAISISVGVPADTLKIKGLRPTVYEDVRDSGAVILRSFCPNCGTPLFTETEGEPTLVFVKSASLDDPSLIEAKFSPGASKNRYQNSTTGHRHCGNIVELPVHNTRLKVS